MDMFPIIMAPEPPTRFCFGPRLTTGKNGMAEADRHESVHCQSAKHARAGCLFGKIFSPIWGEYPQWVVYENIEN